LTDDDLFQGNQLPSAYEDLFGFSAVAERVASAISEQTGKSCFVLGIEGEWGSGKSSLLSILERALFNRGGVVVRFEPWLIGSREALLTELFIGLEKAIANVEGLEGDATHATELQARSVLKQFQSYSGGLKLLSRAAGFAGTLGVPLAEGFEKVLGKSAELLEGGHAPQLTTLKSRCCEALKKLPKRIVVMIDDIDRLEPQEAVEVLRLVQSVADFPNVTYVLCYDRMRLEENVASVVKVSKGYAYLEKIIQVVVPVPYPQSGSLRELFIGRLKAITGQTEISERLARIILRHIGPRIRTPRAVIRCLDAIRLLWPGVKSLVNLDDLVWLQFVRAEDEALYRWIEEYVSEVSHVTIYSDELKFPRSRLKNTLSKIFESSTPSNVDWLELRQFLPMVDHKSEKLIDGALFNTASRELEKAAFFQNRLSSADHARLYFDLVRPKGAVTDDELLAIIQASENPIDVSARLLELAKSSTLTGGSRLEIILEQFVSSIERLRREQARGILIGLLAVADELMQIAKVADRTILRQLLGSLLADMSKKFTVDWSAFLSQALKNARAVDFITAETTIVYPGYNWFDGEVNVENVNVSLSPEEQEVEKDHDYPITGDHVHSVHISWAEGQKRLITEYLANSYVSMEPIQFLESRNLLKKLTIWEFVDNSGFRRFTSTVSKKDQLIATFVKRLFELSVANSPLQDVGILSFKNLVRHYWRPEQRNSFNKIKYSLPERNLQKMLDDALQTLDD